MSLLGHHDRLLPRREQLVRRGGLRAATIALVASIGCSQDDSTHTASDGLTIESLFGGDERNTMAHEAATITQRCMRDRGWATIVITDSVITPRPDAKELAKADAAMAYGVSSPDPEPPPDPNVGLFASLSTSGRTQISDDLWSLDEGRLGCMYVGLRDAFGNMAIASPGWADVVDEISSRLAADPRSIELDARWSRCMAADGLTYQAPAAIIGELLERKSAIESKLGGRPAAPDDAGIPELNRLEHRLYEHDMRCRDHVSYDSSLSAIRVEIEHEVLASHPEVIAYAGD